MKSEMKSSLETFKIRFELTKESINRKKKKIKGKAPQKPNVEAEVYSNKNCD